MKIQKYINIFYFKEKLQFLGTEQRNPSSLEVVTFVQKSFLIGFVEM